MKIFVTGGTGFIGSHFVAAALAAGHEVLALRRARSEPRITLTSPPHWLDGELSGDWSGALRTCDALLHFAAAGVDLRAADWDRCFATNVTASLALWRAAADAGVRSFVIAGSCFEYGRAAERYEFIPPDAPLEPTGPYHASKAAATMAALALAIERKLALTILRPFHVFGPGETPGEAEFRFWPSLVRAARAGEDFPMTAGEQVRDFVSVENIARSFLHAAEHPAAPVIPLIENLGSGSPQTLRAFAEHWWHQLGARGRLLPGALPYRADEVMRYVPLLTPHAA